MNRDAFLARVRRALARTAGHPGGGGEDAQPQGACGLARADHPGDDPASWPERFARELAAVGGSCACVPPGQLADHFAAYARERGLRRAVAWDPAALPAAAGALLQAALAGLARAGCAVETWRGEDAAALRAAAARADAGVVVADGAIAASGTVLLIHGPGRGRLVSLLPEHLAVVVPAGALRPTLPDLMAELAPAARAGGFQNATLITGPSKSADIGLELVTGVHGPRDVHAVVVR